MRVFSKGLQLGALLVVSCAQPPAGVIYACRTQDDCPAGSVCTALQEGRYCLDATGGTAGGSPGGGSAAGGSAAGGSTAGGSTAGGSRSISAVLIRGNRDFNGFEFLTGHLEFVNGSGGVVARGSIVFPRPKADWAGRFAPPISNISQVRFVGGLGQSANPGISELELYGP